MVGTSFTRDGSSIPLMSVSWLTHSASTASIPFSRIGSGSPMQKTQLRPFSRMYPSFVARSAFDSAGVGRPNSPRRSEWPRSTHSIPMSAIWSTAISPVYAPQPVKLQFCGVRCAPLVNLPEHSATCSGDGHTSADASAEAAERDDERDLNRDSPTTDLQLQDVEQDVAGSLRVEYDANGRRLGNT